MKTYRVLQIDAWADCCGCECSEDNPTCWTWNNWFHVDSVSRDLTDKELEQYLIDQIKPEFQSKYEIETDETNMTLVEKDNRRPIIAIEIGVDYE